MGQPGETGSRPLHKERRGGAVGQGIQPDRRLLRGHALTLALSRRAAGEGIKMKGPFFARNDE